MRGACSTPASHRRATGKPHYGCSNASIGWKLRTNGSGDGAPQPVTRTWTTGRSRLVCRSPSASKRSAFVVQPTRAIALRLAPLSSVEDWQWKAGRATSAVTTGRAMSRRAPILANCNGARRWCCPTRMPVSSIYRRTCFDPLDGDKHRADGAAWCRWHRGQADGIFCEPVEIEPSSALVCPPARSLVMVPAAAGNVARACCTRHRPWDGDADAPVPAAPLSRSRSR